MKTICGVFALLGTIFLIVSVIFAAPWWFSAGDVLQTTGRVTRLQARGKGQVPVVEYVVAGRPYEVSGRVSTSPSAYRAGQNVAVTYRRGEPSDAHIDSFAERWLLPIIFGSIGGIFALLGWGGLLLTLHRAPRQKTG